MKSLLYIIAGLLIVIWVIVVKPSGIIHVLLILAAVILIITFVFDKKLSNKSKQK